MDVVPVLDAIVGMDGGEGDQLCGVPLQGAIVDVKKTPA